MADTGKKNKHIGHIIKIAVAAIGLYLAFKDLSWNDIVKLFGAWDSLIIAFGLFFASQLVFVTRWLVLLRVQNISINFFAAVKLHLLGLFYNNCLPGAVGGDALRAWYVTKHTEKKIEAALSVFVDRIVGLASTIAMAFLAYWLIPIDSSGNGEQSGENFNFISLLVKLMIFIAAFVLFAGATLAVMYYNRKLRPILLKYIFILGIRWTFWVGRIINAFKLYCSKPFTLLLAVIMSFICQTIPIFGFWLVGHNLGIEAHIKYYYVFFPLSWIIGIIPISPGGLGVVDLSLKSMFKVIGVPEADGGLLALTQRLILLLISIPGVIIHITGKHLPDEMENPKS